MVQQIKGCFSRRISTETTISSPSTFYLHFMDGKILQGLEVYSGDDDDDDGIHTTIHICGER